MLLFLIFLVTTLASPTVVKRQDDYRTFALCTEPK
jgi:hypothetical protein